MSSFRIQILTFKKNKRKNLTKYWVKKKRETGITSNQLPNKVLQRSQILKREKNKEICSKQESGEAIKTAKTTEDEDQESKDENYLTHIKQNEQDNDKNERRNYIRNKKEIHQIAKEK